MRKACLQAVSVFVSTLYDVFYHLPNVDCCAIEEHAKKVLQHTDKHCRWHQPQTCVHICELYRHLWKYTFTVRQIYLFTVLSHTPDLTYCHCMLYVVQEGGNYLSLKHPNSWHDT